jgi:hypothetical protein
MEYIPHAYRERQDEDELEIASMIRDKDEIKVINA